MLGALAKYIFGGIMGDAPETTSPELQYQTREVNDWLLVDMPDQAIDDEDMDSESGDDDDEILTAIPLLMAEEVVQPVQIVQLSEETKDNSVCDNSYDKVQRCYTDKTHSVPSAVQHHSGGKTQGNFVDNIEAVSLEVEDNLSSKIQDISADVQENSNTIILDEFSTVVQKNSSAVQTDFDVTDPCTILPEDQYISDDEINLDFIFENVLIKGNSSESGHNVTESQDSLKDTDQKFTNKDTLGVNLDEITSTYSEDEGYSDNKVKSHMVVDKVEKRYNMTEFFTQDGFFDSIEDNFYAEVGDDKIQENSEIIQTNLNHREGEFYLENYNHVPVSYNCAQKRLYSQVVQMGRQNQAPTDPMKDIFSDELERKHNLCVRIFGDEIQESSDDEMNETSDDEMSESPKDEMQENYDEDENSNDETKGKSYAVTELSSDEESEEYSEDEASDNFVDSHKRFLQIINRNRGETYNQQDLIKARVFHLIQDIVLKPDICCVPHTEYEHVVGFRNIPQCWYAYESLQEPLLQALLIRNYYLNEPTGQCPHVKTFLCKNVINKKCKREPFPEEKPADPSLVTNSAEILQNLINQKSTPKTGVVLEHIKELKPAQQAMQFENRKYLTRSQLNRQNKNYMYQSSTKSNRRRNLQRNHSGANNNRKC